MRKLRAGLLTRMPDCWTSCGSSGMRELQLVLHLHLRGVGHRALRERQRDRARSRRQLLSEVM